MLHKLNGIVEALVQDVSRSRSWYMEHDILECAAGTTRAIEVPIPLLTQCDDKRHFYLLKKSPRIQIHSPLIVLAANVRIIDDKNDIAMISFLQNTNSSANKLQVVISQRTQSR